MLRPVLAPGVFVEVAAQLVQAVCQQVMGEGLPLALQAPYKGCDSCQRCRLELGPVSAVLTRCGRCACRCASLQALQGRPLLQAWLVCTEAERLCSSPQLYLRAAGLPAANASSRALLPLLPAPPPRHPCADDIMSLPDISVDESEQIPRILEPLTAGLHDAVLPPPLSLAQRAERGDDATAAAAEEEAAWAAAAVGGVRLDDLTTALHERTPAVMKLRVGQACWRQQQGAS